MRITYLHQYFNTPEMTGGTRSYEMARRLTAMGHEVHVVTSWREPGAQDGWFETEEDGIIVHWLPVPYSNNMDYRERILAFLRFAWSAARKAATLPADVVFATSTPLTIALPGAYAARCRNVPMVFEVRDLWPDVPIAMGAIRNPLIKLLARWLERFAYRRSTHVVALSPTMRDGVVDTGYPAECVTVIPNGADLELFDPTTAVPQRFRNNHPELGVDPIVVYTGTIGRINGVGYLTRIAAAAREQGASIQFVVVGCGMEKQAVMEEGCSLGVLNRNFHMYPAASKTEMPHILSAATVSLSLFIDLPVMQANSANKFFDSLASGTPVAINYGGWQADLLKESGAGLQLPANNPQGSARQLTELIINWRKLAKASEAARRLAETRFSRNDLAQKLENVLTSVISA